MKVNDVIKRLQEIKKEFGENYELHTRFSNRSGDDGMVGPGTYPVRYISADKYSNRITLS